MNKLFKFTVVLIFCALFSSFSGYQQAKREIPEYLVQTKIEDKLTPVSVKQIKIGGEIGRRIDVTINNNIKNLNLQKNFTGHFEQKTGPDVVGAFVGMGMLIDASVRFAAYSNDPEMITIKNEIVEKIINAQLENGYSGFYKPERRLWNSKGGGDNWDIHEMAFIIDGMLSDYQFFGNEKALEAAVKTADFIISRWNEMPADYAKEVDMHVLDTGIDWAIVRLYRITGEKRFLRFVEEVKSLYNWETPITIGRRPGVSGHMFAYFAMCMAQMELYRLSGNSDLLKQTENAIHFFLADDGLTITGSAGIREIWTNDQDGEGHLGETCATAYQMRVYESLLRLTGDSKYGDLMERTALNGLFGAQSPDGDKIRYYTPFEGEREYYHVEYMCCPGNYRRIISELPGMVFYTTKNGISVNLYTNSSVQTELPNGTKLQLQQKTNYPGSGKIEISVTPEKEMDFAVLLRVPAWAENAGIKINGNNWEGEIKAGSFVSIQRKWSANDKIELDFPMEFRFVKGRKRNSGKVALMRGPVIYGLNLEKNQDATVNGKRTYNDLRRILIDPATLTGPVSDNSVRPNGTAAFIKAWREEYSGKADLKHEFELKLTEFPDPGSQFIYFKIPDYSIEVDDELIEPIGGSIEMN